jgi:hypothetical protein
MKNLIIYLALMLGLLASKLSAQELNQTDLQSNHTFESRAKAIATKIGNITKTEKDSLKIEIESVNEELTKGLITQEQADEKKKKLAEARATIIENKVAIVQEELKDLVQQKVDGQIIESDTIKKPTRIILKWEKGNKDYNKTKNEKRTTSQFVFAIGLNNLATDESLENSDYRFLGSHFYEWGVTYNTRLAKNNNLLHLKYGWSVMYNNLRPTDNRSFVVIGDQTNLQTSAYHLDDSRLRNVYLVAPLHLEFDFSGKSEKDGKEYFQTHQSIRFGLGGYGGIRLKTKQILKYDDEFGDNVKQKTKKDFNASNYVYGISSYIGYKSTSLYVKYDLNPLFQHNAVKQNNVSLGIRFDFN